MTRLFYDTYMNNIHSEANFTLPAQFYTRHPFISKLKNVI